MPNFKRMFMPGGCWFFTVCLQDRRSTLLVDETALLRKAFHDARRTLPFRIDAVVVLPNHLHTIWTLPADDGNFAARWRSLKGQFSRSMPVGEWRSRSRIARGERGIWQRRFWEHRIRDADDFARYVEYCYINPVKHGLVRHAGDWPYSSFHRDVRAGLLPADWAGKIVKGAFGEPEAR
jgi:putative transposase